MSGHVMSNPAIDIPNLLYRYADLIDAAEFDAAAALFDHGHLIAAGERVEGREAICAMWRTFMKLHADGTPRSRHLITNPIIELAADGQTAVCRSQWTVLQAVEDYPLQPVATGRYLDKLALMDGTWAFTERNYLQIDLMGDVSEHLLTVPPAELARQHTGQQG